MDAIAAHKAAAVAAGATSAEVSDATCGICKSSGLGCPVGMNNHTYRIVFASPANAMDCNAGGIQRMDPAYGVVTSYCEESLAAGSIAAFVLAPILVMFAMCAAACCAPCLKRALGIKEPVEPPVPLTPSVVLVGADADAAPPRAASIVLVSADAAPQAAAALPPVQQPPMEKQPGCFSAPFKEGARVPDLPSYDISRYSAAERALITYSIEQGVALYSQPPYNPAAPDTPRIALRSWATRAVRTTCCCGTGTFAWLLVAVVDLVDAALRRAVAAARGAAFGGWHGCDALGADMWFFFKQHHVLLCTLPWLRHPLHPVATHVHVVSFLTEALFAYFTAWLMGLCNVGGDGGDNFDYVYNTTVAPTVTMR